MASMEPGTAGNGAELDRLQRQRRILLKGGIVLTLDRRVGDFAKADVLIEDGRIGDVRPDIGPVGDDAAVIDASDRIIIPGFVDTHSHSYQGLLRSSLPCGIVEPDYKRDIQDIITPAYRPADVFAGVLVTALGMIDIGTTALVDISQSNHTPEHSDALIAALAEAGIRAVCAYSRGSGPGSQFPQDSARLRRTYFNSEDQLLTLALAVAREARTFRFAREAGLQAVLHIRLDSQVLLALGKAGLLRPCRTAGVPAARESAVRCQGATASPAAAENRPSRPSTSLTSRPSTCDFSAQSVTIEMMLAGAEPPTLRLITNATEPDRVGTL
jgi:hypothetical protein